MKKHPREFAISVETDSPRVFSQRQIHLGPIAGDPRIRRWLLLVASIASGIYLLLSYLFFFQHAVVLDWFGALNFIEPDRLEAKSANIMFGLTTIFIVGLVTMGLEFCLQRRSYSAIFASRYRFYEFDSSWFNLACRFSALFCALTIPVFFLRFVMGLEWLYVEDGPLEYATAFGYAASSLICLGTFGLLWRERTRSRLLAALTLGGVLGFAFIALEEISWGQRLFGIATPHALSEVNTQNELNVHNLFTDHFNRAYFLMGVAFFVCFGLGLLIQLRKHPGNAAAWLPHPLLLLLAAQITCFSFHLEANELIEPISAVFCVLYAIQLSRLARSRVK